jgi:hypothetical protein
MTGDTDLRDAFRNLAAVTNPYVRPPGADLAQLRARVRIRNRRMLAAAAAALAVLVPAGLVALAQGGGSSSLPIPPATSVPSPTATATTTPPPDAPYGQPVRGPGALVNATLTLSWPDPEDDEYCGATFTVPADTEPGLDTGRPTIMSTMHFDIDGDGTREIVAHVYCRLGQVGPEQIIALRSTPEPTMLGTVVATGSVTGQGELAQPGGVGIAAIQGYGGQPDGTIWVEVKNRRTCCATPPESAVAQLRTYEWSGTSFDQVDGPISFMALPSVADVEVSVPTLAFGAPVDGFRTATLIVTIHNNGPHPAPSALAYIEYPFRIEEPSGGDWERCLDGSDGALLGVESYTVCELGTIAAGETVTLTLPMRRSSQYEAEESPHFSTYTGRVEVRADGLYYPSKRFGLTVA